MATNPKFSYAAGTAMANALITAMASGKMHLYDGTQPASPDTAASGNDYCSTPLALSSTAGTAANGVITMNAITSATCTYTGTPTWFRIFASNGTTGIVDGTIGTSGCDLNFSAGTSFISGGTIAISSLTITIPTH